jgi:hypothetical protein
VTATPKDILQKALTIAWDIASSAAIAEEKKDRPIFQRWMSRSIAEALLAERNRKSSKDDGK